MSFLLRSIATSVRYLYYEIYAMEKDDDKVKMWRYEIGMRSKIQPPF